MALVAGVTRQGKSVAHHAGELGITTVGSRLTMTAESSNLGKVEPELVLQPVDSISGAAGQDGDKIVAGEVTSLRAGLVIRTPHVNARHVQISWYPQRRFGNYPESPGLADFGFQHR